MGNIFDQFDVVNDPSENKDSEEYKAPNPFDVFDSPPVLESIARSTGEPFNRGVINILEFPVALVNAAVAGGYALAGQDSAPQMLHPLTQIALSAGLIAPEEERKEGVIPRAFEFTGAGIIPATALLNYGRLALSELSAVPTALKQLGAATAKSPGITTAYDIAANFTSASGGEVARQFTDNETIIAMAELGAGFLPTVSVIAAKALPNGQLVGKAYDWILETLAPFSQSGARVAAAKRLQSVSADPKSVAEKLDINSPVPPMQQSGDPGILKLQDIILKSNPKLRQEWSEQLDLAIKQLSREMELPGGDIERAVHILNIRQQMAIEEASAAVQSIGQNATPREISVAARRSAQAALDDAVSLESAVWERLDTKAPADIENAANVISEIIASRSPDADPNEIPKWLLDIMSRSPIGDDLMDQLQKQGYVGADGSIDPAILSALEKQGALQTRQRTLDDVKVLRGRVLQEMRDEKAAQGRGPNRNKLRILNKVQSALLDDMSATDVPGIDEARAFSRAVNERFRNGRVGKLLGFDSTGAERVSEEDFLQNIVYGPASATTSKLFGEMANEAPDLTLNFIKSKYMESVVGENNIVSQTAHNVFIKSMKTKGMFEIFPELEGELNRVSKLGAEAMKLEVPANQINTTRLNKNQSRSALLLQANPGEEMSLVLKSRNPSGAIQDLMKVKTPTGRILASDRSAVLGLQDSFVEEMFTLSSREVNGFMVPQGNLLKVHFEKYKTVMDALHMSNQQKVRLNGLIEQIKIAQMSSNTNLDIGTTILDTNLKAPVEFLARVMGARAGGKLGNNMGASLVIAGFVSRKTRERILRLTTSEAEKLLIMAVSDGELYRSLLINPRANISAQKRAAKSLERAIARLGNMGVTTLAISASQDNEFQQNTDMPEMWEASQ